MTFTSEGIKEKAEKILAEYGQNPYRSGFTGMTQEEYLIAYYLIRRDMPHSRVRTNPLDITSILNTHKNNIRLTLQDGKTIPDRVLREYLELNN